MILAHIAIEVNPENRDLLITTATDAMEKSQAEEGCILYQFSADLKAQNRFYLSELWASQEALDAHLAQPYTKNALSVFGSISKMDIKLYRGEMEAGTP